MVDEVAVFVTGRAVRDFCVTGAGVTIRLARSDDLAPIVEIERAAGELFRSVGMDLVADDDPPTVEELAFYAEGGRAFVAASADDRPVGYLLLDEMDGAAHIEQLSVHPSMPAAVSAAR
jgi:hypothetical protein